MFGSLDPQSMRETLGNGGTHPAFANGWSAPAGASPEQAQAAFQAQLQQWQQSQGGGAPAPGGPQSGVANPGDARFSIANPFASGTIPGMPAHPGGPIIDPLDHGGPARPYMPQQPPQQPQQPPGANGDFTMRGNMPSFGSLAGMGQASPQGVAAAFPQFMNQLQAPQLGNTAPSWNSIWPNAQNGPTGQPGVGQPPAGVASPEDAQADAKKQAGLIAGMTEEDWARALGLPFGGAINSSGGGGM